MVTYLKALLACLSIPFGLVKLEDEVCGRSHGTIFREEELWQNEDGNEGGEVDFKIT